MHVCVHCLSTVLMLPSVADLYLKVWSFVSSFSVHIPQETPDASYPVAPNHQINQPINHYQLKIQQIKKSIFWLIYSICSYLATDFVQVVEFLNMSFQLCKYLFTYTMTILEPVVGTHLPVQILQEQIYWHIFILMYIETYRIWSWCRLAWVIIYVVLSYELDKQLIKGKSVACCITEEWGPCRQPTAHMDVFPAKINHLNGFLKTMKVYCDGLVVWGLGHL